MRNRNNFVSPNQIRNTHKHYILKLPTQLDEKVRSKFENENFDFSVRFNRYKYNNSEEGIGFRETVEHIEEGDYREYTEEGDYREKSTRPGLVNLKGKKKMKSMFRMKMTGNEM